jgi:hypothetical protein
MLAVFAMAVVLPLQGLAHEGHDHKVLGTVTMAAADHVMLEDKDNKDVTVYLTRETKEGQEATEGRGHQGRPSRGDHGDHREGEQRREDGGEAGRAGCSPTGTVTQ